MKTLIIKSNFILSLLAVIALIYGCEKEEISIDDNVKAGAIPDVIVENGYLSFKSIEVFDSINENLYYSDDKYYSWLNNFDNFKTAKAIYDEAESELDSIMDETDQNLFNQKYKDYLIIKEDGVDYKFYSNLFMRFLNPEGIVKVEGVIYKFTKDRQISVLSGNIQDLNDFPAIENSSEIVDVFFPNPKNDEMLKSSTWGNLWFDRYTGSSKRLNVSLDLTKIYSPVYEYYVHTGWNVGFDLRLNASQQRENWRGKWKSSSTTFTFWDATYNLTYQNQGHSFYLPYGNSGGEGTSFYILYCRKTGFWPKDRIYYEERPTIHNVYTKITSRGIGENYVYCSYSDN